MLAFHRVRIVGVIPLAAHSGVSNGDGGGFAQLPRRMDDNDSTNLCLDFPE